MKKVSILFRLFITIIFIGCNSHPDAHNPKVKTENFTFTQDVDDQKPPPANLKTKFRNVQAWLSKICDGSKPAKSIQTYNFGLFESPKENTLFLIGTNTYQDKNHSIVRIEYRPTELFYRLPDKEYQELNREQLLNKLTSELKDFTTTKKFKSSFLTEANSIKTDFGGEIWKK